LFVFVLIIYTSKTVQYYKIFDISTWADAALAKMKIIKCQMSIRTELRHTLQ